MNEEKEEMRLPVKFIMNKDKTKVLFAEAGRDFTDALLSFLVLPLGTIVKILQKHHGDEKAAVIGSLSTLYNSLANLDTFHFSTEDAKNLLVNPTSLDAGEHPRFDRAFTETRASFIIGDDLKVMRSVEGSIMSTLSSLGVAMTEMDGAETWNLKFGYKEMMALLRMMFVSRKPLTALLRGHQCTRAARQANPVVNKIGKRALSMNPKKMILKVMIQKSTNKLLFAQAHGNFVSFLFGLLAIPLGRVEWYLHSNTGITATDNLHWSIMDSLYGYDVMTTEAKDLLFKPPLLDDVSCNEMDAQFGSCNDYLSLSFDRSKSRCHVRGSTMYMVSDDLRVTPLSVSSGVSVINEMKVALSDVKEMELHVGLEEGLSILKAALTSTMALTDGLINLMLKNKNHQPKQENLVD